MFSFLRRDRSDRVLSQSSLHEPVYRHFSHGPILPMEQPSLLERFFSRR